MTRTLLTAIFLTLFSQTAWAHDNSPKMKELERQIIELQKELKVLKLATNPETAETIAGAMNLLKNLEKSGQDYKEEQASKKYVGDYLFIADWSLKEIKGQYGQKDYEVSIWLQNKSDKKIALVNGSVVFSDKADSFYRKVEFSGDISLKAGQTQKYRAIEQHMFIKDLDVILTSDNPHLYTAYLDIEKIVFDDGEVIEVRRAK